MKNQFKGTPGKWHYQELSDAYTHIVRPDDNPGNIIVQMRQDTSGVTEANARLIAAAPELLKACQAFMELFTDSDMRPEDESYEVAGIIQEAINKALGKEAVPCEK